MGIVYIFTYLHNMFLCIVMVPLNLTLSTVYVIPIVIVVY